MGGVKWVFLNTSKVTDDLLEKRSAIYSSRPDFPMTQDIISGGNRIVLMKYSDRWRSLRKVSKIITVDTGHASTFDGETSRFVSPIPRP
jgi:hypothetical protein